MICEQQLCLDYRLIWTYVIVIEKVLNKNDSTLIINLLGPVITLLAYQDQGTEGLRH